MYTIKCCYETGNSFNSYDTEDVIDDIEWNDLDVARANLKRIQEHYAQYQAINSLRDNRSIEEIFDSNKDKDWFRKDLEDDFMKQSSLFLYTDAGKPYAIHADWCGYFETLHSAEIIMPDEQNLNKIEF